jgi:hypothetical protein
LALGVGGARPREFLKLAFGPSRQAVSNDHLQPPEAVKDAPDQLDGPPQVPSDSLVIDAGEGAPVGVFAGVD